MVKDFVKFFGKAYIASLLLTVVIMLMVGFKFTIVSLLGLIGGSIIVILIVIAVAFLLSRELP